MSLFNKVLLLSVMLGVLLETPPSDDFSIAVQNDKSEDVTVHCKSKDDDLGSHVLKTGQDFQWNFHANSGGTTLYFCHVTTKEKFKQFDAFKWPNDRQRCSP
ncbi:hypothetical protein WN944_026378 [Citrus x changshan-huyou]|uniref:S-protein homolog n=1 Tax=Citrus x changshan-huyou TaxID=2935761 RepID=A0AAP0QDV5_9ROSI